MTNPCQHSNPPLHYTKAAPTFLTHSRWVSFKCMLQSHRLVESFLTLGTVEADVTLDAESLLCELISINLSEANSCSPPITPPSLSIPTNCPDFYWYKLENSKRFFWDVCPSSWVTLCISPVGVCRDLSLVIEAERVVEWGPEENQHCLA